MILSLLAMLQVAFFFLFIQSLSAITATKGMVTGTENAVLNGQGSQACMKLVSSIFYDDRGRAIQTKALNITGGIDITTTQYNFSGQPLMTLLQQEKAGTNAQTIKLITKIEYDALNRPKQIKKKITQTVGGNTYPASPVERIIVTNEYDKMGQLIRKVLAPEYNSNAGLEKLDYEYNVRGWMNGFNKDYISGSTTHYFGMELAYDKTTSVAPGASYVAAQYNGNITGTVWKSKGDGVERQYDFGYDKLNRLLKGDFKQHNSNNSWNNSEVNYNVKMGDGSDYSSAYDENGNIKKMQQWGLNLNSSVQIDNLTYTYAGLSNKLLKVADAAAVVKLGDFTEGYNSGDDYEYDVNGNMVTDENKAIGTLGSPGIVYNHLNLPEIIYAQAGHAYPGNIYYVYDAAGNKLQKVVHDDIGRGLSTDKVTTYMGGMVYESFINNGDPGDLLSYTDVLQFAGHEEGRIRFKPSTTAPDFAYDYFIKDHLGNVRMVLTEEAQQDKYPVASMEDTKQTIEPNYYSIDNSKIVNKSTVTGLPAYTNDNGIGNNPHDATFEAANSDKLYQLNSNSNKMGLGMTLKVMAGDKLDIFGKSYYFTNSPGSSYNSAIPMLDLLAGFLGNPTAVAATAAHGAVTPSAINTTTGVAGINSIFSNQTSQSNGSPNIPKAFINYIFFDEQFKSVGGGFSQVGSNSTIKDHYSQLQNISISKNGFVYIYCSNESPVNVFFDNIQVVHTRGPILEEKHYYPFGLIMSGISAKASNFGNENKKGYAGNEIQNKEFTDGSGLEIYDFNARTYDQQIGRFIQLDPLTEEGGQESWSCYHYSYNNPIIFSDPDGKFPFLLPALPAIGAAVGEAIGTLIVTVATAYYYSEGLKEAKVGFGKSAAQMDFALERQLLAESKNAPQAKKTAAQSGSAAKAASAAVNPNGDKKGPDPNKGVAKKHGGTEHNNSIDNKVEELNNDVNVINIRKNQQQVDVAGNKVGTNRPDVQYDRYNEKTKKWEHHVIEYDTKASSSIAHGEKISTNDPKAKIELNLLK